MLLKKEYISKTTLLAIWKIEENGETLLSRLESSIYADSINNIKSESRVLEKLAIYVLLKEITGEEKIISHHSTGRPYLTDGSYHISISHTKGYVAVLLDKNSPIAIDIEQITDKVQRIKSRFISDTEYINSENELKHLLLHWSAKEALYKLLDKADLDFQKHMFVQPFEPKDKGCFRIQELLTESKSVFVTQYRIENDFVLVCITA